jgi:hypothetical protein
MLNTIVIYPDVLPLKKFVPPQFTTVLYYTLCIILGCKVRLGTNTLAYYDGGKIVFIKPRQGCV